MRRRSLFAGALGGLFSVAAPTFSAEAKQATPVPGLAYTITDLGTLGGQYSNAWAINAHGQAVGWAEDGDGQMRAALWADGRITDLGTFGGAQSIAYDINDAGQIVGVSTVAPGHDVFEDGGRAFLWEDGRMIDLGTLGGETSIAVHVNNAGQVVGSATDASGVGRAFRWEDGRMIAVDPGPKLDVEDSATAMSINDGGAIVGNVETMERAYPLLWIDGKAAELASSDEYSPGYVWDINNRGQIAGSATAPDGTQVAVMWDNGRIIEVSTLGRENQALALNDRGDVVGYSAELPDAWALAFLWTDGQLVDLTAAIPQGKGWFLHFATGINDAGQIVGNAEVYGVARAYLLTPERAGGGHPGTSSASLHHGDTNIGTRT